MKKANYFLKPVLLLGLGFISALFFQNCAKSSFSNSSPTTSEKLEVSSQSDSAVQESLAIKNQLVAMLTIVLQILTGTKTTDYQRALDSQTFLVTFK